MKKILITNDDGFDSLGLKALKEALEPLGEVTVVAPTLEQVCLWTLLKSY